MNPEPPIAGLESLTEVPRPAFDVCNPDRLPADRLPFVEGIHQQFLLAFGQALTALLDTPVKATPAGIDQWPVAEFLKESATDGCVVTLDLSPMRGQAWAGLSPRLVFRVLDILLGAPQTTAPAARNSITEIERHVLHPFFQALIATLDKAWSPSGISLRKVSIGTVEEAPQTAEPDGTVLVLHGQIRIVEDEETFRIAVPVLAVRVAALQNEQHAAGEVAGETSARTALLEVISGATVQLEAVLGGSSIRLGDLAAMQPGQILALTQPAGSQLDCLINGKAKFRGDWIAHGDRQGLQVDAVVDSAAAGKH
jgi:flagellar motor switch protein FliM